MKAVHANDRILVHRRNECVLDKSTATLMLCISHILLIKLLSSKTLFYMSLRLEQCILDEMKEVKLELQSVSIKDEKIGFGLVPA